MPGNLARKPPALLKAGMPVKSARTIFKARPCQRKRRFAGNCSTKKPPRHMPGAFFGLPVQQACFLNGFWPLPAHQRFHAAGGRVQILLAKHKPVPLVKAATPLCFAKTHAKKAGHTGFGNTAAVLFQCPCFGVRLYKQPRNITVLHNAHKPLHLLIFHCIKNFAVGQAVCFHIFIMVLPKPFGHKRMRLFMAQSHIWRKRIQRLGIHWGTNEQSIRHLRHMGSFAEGKQGAHHNGHVKRKQAPKTPWRY